MVKTGVTGTVDRDPRVAVKLRAYLNEILVVVNGLILGNLDDYSIAPASSRVRGSDHRA